MLWQYRHHLPWHGLVANILWALVNFTMAFLVVRFTLMRTRFRRREYRFPVPLPARIQFTSGEEIMTVDDVSSSGCRLYGRFPEQIGIGDTVQGVLLLPGDSLGFTAKVASLIPGKNEAESWVKSLGLEFQWTDNASRNQLDLFLYGSDLQWQINRISERSATPSEILQPGRERNADNSARPQPWAAIEMNAVNGDQDAGLITVAGSEGGTRVLASYSRIDGRDQIAIREHTRRGITHYVLRPRRVVAHIGTPTGAMYLTEMETC